MIYISWKKQQDFSQSIAYIIINICIQISLFSKLFIICIIAKKCLKSSYIQFKIEMNVGNRNEYYVALESLLINNLLLK